MGAFRGAANPDAMDLLPGRYVLRRLRGRVSLLTSRLRTSPMTKLQVAAVVLHLRCVFDAIISIQINGARRAFWTELDCLAALKVYAGSM